MKFVLSSLLPLLCFYNVVAQKIDSASLSKLTPAQREEVNVYLQKERKHNTTGAIMCIVGGAAAIGGAVLVKQAWDEDVWFDGQEPNDVPGVILLTAGGITALLSIIQFKLAHKNGRAAKAIVFVDKGVSTAPNILIPGSQSAGIKFIIPIGK